MREGTLHLVYFREYEDSEERYDPCFNIYHTIFRNLPLSQMNRLNNKDFQNKVKEFCDKISSTFFSAVFSAHCLTFDIVFFSFFI